jgi:hypothetical protein
MTFNSFLHKINLTLDQVSSNSGLDKQMIKDISIGKINIYDCPGKILSLLANSLSISIEDLLDLEYR